MVALHCLPPPPPPRIDFGGRQSDRHALFLKVYDLCEEPGEPSSGLRDRIPKQFSKSPPCEEKERWVVKKHISTSSNIEHQVLGVVGNRNLRSLCKRFRFGRLGFRVWVSECVAVGLRTLFGLAW